VDETNVTTLTGAADAPTSLSGNSAYCEAVRRQAAQVDELLHVPERTPLSGPVRLPEHLAIIVGLGPANLFEELDIPAPVDNAHENAPAVEQPLGYRRVHTCRASNSPALQCSSHALSE
jgi:hypothetical protein